MLKAVGMVAIATATLVSIWSAEATAQGDAKRGGQQYRACASCHSLQPGVHLTGPSLADVWGKKAASVAGFERYSKALRTADVVWDENTLNAWLADPKALVPGNAMIFPGIRDNRARGDLIAFLREAMAPDGYRSVVDKGLVAKELAEGQAPEPIGSVGPDQQVTAIRHCRDTYFITTADGRETPFWELNVRLKTDASRTGPGAGKPVLMPAGMMGDRVLIIFSSPAEISTSIERRC